MIISFIMRMLWLFLKFEYRLFLFVFAIIRLLRVIFPVVTETITLRGLFFRVNRILFFVLFGLSGEKGNALLLLFE
jgi:hypothetical protein